ncbi:MAG: c-type cytochrome [Pseudomonadota bacterium]|nr:c-type cytochrome [Pseudomonadota bacterium]
MTDQTNKDENAGAQQGGGDMFNTAAGWVLFAGVVGLGLSILSGKYFHGYDPERPETPGYVIEGVDTGEGKAAEMTMAEALTLVTAEEGAKIYQKCQACHTIEAGGKNGIGPNLNGIMGADIAAKAGFKYSSALSAQPGNWGWDEMNLWLKNPKGYIEGSVMGFAGLSKIEDRAAVALYLNEQGSNLALPEFTPPAEDEAVAEAEDEAVEAGEAEAAAEQNDGEEIAAEAEAEA